MLEEIRRITTRHTNITNNKMTLMEWLSDIFIAELFDPDKVSNAEVYEAKDAKLTYIPGLQVFNILIYVTENGCSKEITLPLSIALEDTIGCTDIAEAKDNLKFMKSDCTFIAKEMQMRINDALYLYSRSWPLFDC